MRDASEPRVDVRLVEGPVRYEHFDAFPDDCGAECAFLGRTRAEDHAAHGALARLDYEVHPRLAERVLREIADEAVARFGLRAARIVHAIGPVALGEASVLVQAAAGHRGAAFDGCRFLIDALKERAPIWKREAWRDAATWAPGQPVADPGSAAP